MDSTTPLIHVSGCFSFPDINISQASVATRLRCGGIFYYHFAINAKTVSDRIVNISQHLGKLEAKIKWNLSGHDASCFVHSCAFPYI